MVGAFVRTQLLAAAVTEQKEKRPEEINCPQTSSCC
jgi:hypothetical protein